jgi:hypothetical protein
MVHGPQACRAGIAPDRPQELFPVHDAVRALREVLEELEIAVRQVDIACVVPRPHLREVDRDVSKLQLIDVGTGSSQHRADACQQLLELERLGDVVVGAEREAADLVGLLPHRGQKDDRRAGALPPAGADVEPALAGKRHVEQDEIGREVSYRVCRGPAVRDALDVESLEREVVAENAREHRVVFDDENPPLHGFTLPSGA